MRDSAGMARFICLFSVPLSALDLMGAIPCALYVETRSERSLILQTPSLRLNPESGPEVVNIGPFRGSWVRGVTR